MRKELEARIAELLEKRNHLYDAKIVEQKKLDDATLEIYSLDKRIDDITGVISTLKDAIQAYERTDVGEREYEDGDD